MGSALFWGLLLIILGLSLVFRIVFNIDFPLIKIVIAFALIFLGIKMLFGSFMGFSRVNVSGNDSDVIFGEKRYDKFSNHKEYNVIFGKGVYDFRDYNLLQDAGRIKISSVFGSTEIKLNKNTPVRVKVDAAFAGVHLPNGNSTAFGTSVYESPGLDIESPYLELKLDVIFGGAELDLY